MVWREICDMQQPHMSASLNDTSVWQNQRPSPLDKMAAISQTIFSDAFSWMKNIWILITISLNFVPKCSINNIPALVQIMACRLFGAKPLSEPMLIRFTDAYMRHYRGDELMLLLPLHSPFFGILKCLGEWVILNFQRCYLKKDETHIMKMENIKREYTVDCFMWNINIVTMTFASKDRFLPCKRVLNFLGNCDCDMHIAITVYNAVTTL